MRVLQLFMVLTIAVAALTTLLAFVLSSQSGDLHGKPRGHHATAHPSTDDAPPLFSRIASRPLGTRSAQSFSLAETTGERAIDSPSMGRSISMRYRDTYSFEPRSPSITTALHGADSLRRSRAPDDGDERSREMAAQDAAHSTPDAVKKWNGTMLVAPDHRVKLMETIGKMGRIRSVVSALEHSVAALRRCAASMTKGESAAHKWIVLMSDPRQLLEQCLRASERAADECVDAAVEYGDAMAELFEAGEVVPLRNPVQESMVGAEVNITHHVQICSGRSTRFCVLVLDADDAMVFQRHTTLLAMEFLASGAPTNDVSEHFEGAEPLEIPPLVSPAGRYGSFQDSLTGEQLDIVWSYDGENTTARWGWMKERSIVVEPRDVVWGTVIFFHTKKARTRDYLLRIENLARSMRYNGGRLNEAEGILLCVTIPREADRCNEPRRIARRFNMTAIAIDWYPEWLNWLKVHADQANLLKTDFLTHPRVLSAKVSMFIDADIIIFEDPLPFVSPRHLRMSTGGGGSRPGSRLLNGHEENWAQHGFEKPPKGPCSRAYDGTEEWWFHNGGMMWAPSHIMRVMGEELIQRAVVDINADGPWHGRDQLLISLSYYRTLPPFIVLPNSVNFQSQFSKVACKSSYAEQRCIAYHYKDRMEEASGVPTKTTIGSKCDFKNDFNAKLKRYCERVANDLERSSALQGEEANP